VSKIHVDFIRGKRVESSHQVKALVTNVDGKVLLSTNNDNEFFFPRSSIKIFQAIPFAMSNAIKNYKLNTKHIALACASHKGEKFHIKELKKWISKINLKTKNLQCGIHAPLDKNASEKIIYSRKKFNELHNNCAGKHLGMLTSCLVNNQSITNYLDYNHVHQKNIRKIFNKFTESKLSKKNFSLDGCSAPQYSFKIKSISKALNNLIKSYKNNYDYSDQVRTLVNSILENPEFIGGTVSFDTKVIKASKGKIFCKSGAEGVFLFVDFQKEISGVIKITDGNERAIPIAILNIFKKFKVMSKIELKKLEKKEKFELKNHAGRNIGRISLTMK
jgi:L-asparaginase II